MGFIFQSELICAQKEWSSLDQILLLAEDLFTLLKSVSDIVKHIKCLTWLQCLHKISFFSLSAFVKYRCSLTNELMSFKNNERMYASVFCVWFWFVHIFIYHREKVSRTPPAVGGFGAHRFPPNANKHLLKASVFFKSMAGLDVAEGAVVFEQQMLYWFVGFVVWVVRDLLVALNNKQSKLSHGAESNSTTGWMWPAGLSFTHMV